MATFGKRLVRLVPAVASSLEWCGRSAVYVLCQAAWDVGNSFVYKPVAGIAEVVRGFLAD
eukprot:981860-Amphidinium_carterae.1